jgi:hypothetical protein
MFFSFFSSVYKHTLISSYRKRAQKYREQSSLFYGCNFHDLIPRKNARKVTCFGHNKQSLFRRLVCPYSVLGANHHIKFFHNKHLLFGLEFYSITTPIKYSTNSIILQYCLRNFTNCSSIIIIVSCIYVHKNFTNSNPQVGFKFSHSTKIPP